MRKQYFLATALAALVFFSGNAPADDTDIYVNNTGTLPPNSEPMVMFSLDYRPNLGASHCAGTECDFLIAEGWLSPVGPYTFFDVLRAILKKVMDPLSGVKVGLMLNHADGAGCTGYGAVGCSNGGHIAMGFQLFDAFDSNGAKARFHAILDAMPIPQGAEAHKYQGKELFFEFFRYLTGQEVYNGHNGWVDYATDATLNLDVDNPGASWDPTIELPPPTNPLYSSPLIGVSECTRIFTVNTMFQVSQQDNDSDLALGANHEDQGGFGENLPNLPDFTDVIRHMNETDFANGSYGTVPKLEEEINVTSYFIVSPTKINTKTIGYAQAGGTGLPLPFSRDPQELVNALNEIFRQIISVSTTFVSASVPVNVFNRSQIIDNVFLALFRVDDGLRPFWPGNIKKLKLINANDPLLPVFLADANGRPAVAPDGRVRFDALTYWTDGLALPPPDITNNEVAGADGRSVARGGAGQKIPGYLFGSPKNANGLGGRTIYYDAAPNALAPFNINLATITALQPEFGFDPVPTIAETAALMAYARGLDVDDLDLDLITDEPRDWIMGDPLHSRPLALNYGAVGGYTEANPLIYIAVGTNDGFLHMIRNTNPGGSQSGAEVWAFMPKIAMPNQKILRLNKLASKHPYSVDGPPVAYYDDTNLNGTIEIGEKVYLYFGLRRGGKAYYAMDVTNPESPVLMWTITKSGDFAELGHTFSTPRIGKIKTGGVTRPVLIFAGGYDMNKDDSPDGDSEGNAIYVVDAVSGALIWKASGSKSAIASATVFKHAALQDSIASTVAIADTDGDTYTDRIVVGDTGGNVWRADLTGATTSDWKLTLLAALGRHGPGADDFDFRRFFHRPDLVPSHDALGPFDAVLIGSGNRADPLDKEDLSIDFFYMIKDRNVIPGTGVDTGLTIFDLGDVTSNCLQVGGVCSVDLTNGWKMEMLEEGEKVLSTALTINGQVFFTTYLPNAGLFASVCLPSEGAGRLYTVGLQDARSVINYNTIDDNPLYPDQPTTTADRYQELYSPGIPSEVVSVPPNKILRPDLTIQTIDVSTRWRTFWYIDEESDQ